MPSPTSSLVTLRPDLAGSLEEFNLAMDRMGFIGHRVYPVFEVAKQAGVFGRIPIEQLLQKRNTNRAPGGGYSRGTWKFTTDSYATEEHGAEEPVDEREAAMYAEYFDAEMVSRDRALDAVLRNAEQRICDKVFNATTFSGAALNTTITNEWDDGANAVPIDDVEGAVQKVWDASGIWPNALIINRKVFRNLRNVDQIVDRLKYQGNWGDIAAENITAQMLAALFDLRYVLVAGSAKNTADEGQDASISSIWSDEYAMVCRIAESNDVREPCLGRTFHWSGDGSQIDGLVESYEEPQTRSDIVRVRHDVDEKELYIQAGHLLDNVTT